MKDAATAAKTIETTAALLARGRAPSAAVQRRVVENAAALNGSLWPALEADADAHSVTAHNALAQRARREADDLRTLLARPSAVAPEATTRRGR